MNKQILSEKFRRMQKLAGLINENQNFNLLEFIQQNKNEIIETLQISADNDRISDLKNISSDVEGNVLATIVIDDYTIVSFETSPNAVFDYNGELATIRDVFNNPKIFKNKTLPFKHTNMSKWQNKKISYISTDEPEIGFFEKRKTHTNIIFSTKSITNDEKSGNINVNNKTIYWAMYDE